MQRYANHSGESGVAAYHIGNDSITVQFSSGDRYVYTVHSAGAANIARMRKLALEGRGLSTYISRHVRDGYEKKPG